jgi:phycoerythrobilin:ferredoxin oxidoreductase
MFFTSKTASYAVLLFVYLVCLPSLQLALRTPLFSSSGLYAVKNGQFSPKKIAESEIVCGSRFEDAHRSVMRVFTELETKNGESGLQQVAIDVDLQSNRGSVPGSTEDVEFKCIAYTSGRFQCLRTVSFAGAGYDVFNFLVIPRSCLALPIFSVDIVKLPGTLLAAIDWQPSSRSGNGAADDPDGLYTRLEPLHRQLTSLLPDGGPLPDDARQFFSPQALWWRVPLSAAASSSSSSYDKDDSDSGGPSGIASAMKVITDAIQLYADAYADVAANAPVVPPPPGPPLSPPPPPDEAVTRRSAWTREYLHYRIEKDPARRLLLAAFGAVWLDKALSKAVFPLQLWADEWAGKPRDPRGSVR